MQMGFGSRPWVAALLAGLWLAARALCTWVEAASLLLLEIEHSGEDEERSATLKERCRAHDDQALPGDSWPGKDRSSNSQAVELPVRMAERKGRAKVVIIRHRLSPVLHVLFFWSWLLLYLSIVDLPRPAGFVSAMDLFERGLLPIPVGGGS